MKTFDLKDFTKGWIIGFFEDSIFKTNKYELGVKHYKAGDYEPAHFHLEATEITIIASGKVEMNGHTFVENDIIVIARGEATDFKCITDVITCVYKDKSVKNDKYLVTSNTQFKICDKCSVLKTFEAFAIKDKNTLRQTCISCSSDRIKNFIKKYWKS